ncbi:MAG: hydroxymyristoyl-ACP dehydratase [Treponema sp.]|nr:hydroxymyristoyl-ACP dehydratase [Treponema sp.]
MNEKIITQAENSVALEFSVPDTSPYFDGHFPEFPILPAVAQVDLILRFASQYLGTGIVLPEIRRIKFSSLIRPFTHLFLSLEKNGTTISFRMTSPDRQVVYSLGTLKITAG